MYLCILRCLMASVVFLYWSILFCSMANNPRLKTTSSENHINLCHSNAETKTRPKSCRATEGQLVHGAPWRYFDWKLVRLCGSVMGVQLKQPIFCKQKSYVAEELLKSYLSYLLNPHEISQKNYLRYFCNISPLSVSLLYNLSKTTPHRPNNFGQKKGGRKNTKMHRWHLDT